MNLAYEWLEKSILVMNKIKETQSENIMKAAQIMADTLKENRWVHTFGCGHATLPIEEIYPRIGGFVGFHPIIELPLTFFTNIVGSLNVHEFVFLERVEGYGNQIMKGYNFDKRDCIWIFSHTGINAVNIDIALESKKRGMKVIAYGAVSESINKKSRHSSGKNIFEIADLTVDTCVPIEDATIKLPNHFDKVGPISTIAFVSAAWMTVITVAEILDKSGIKLFIHPSHNIPSDTTAHERLENALKEYKNRIAGV